MGTLAPTKYIDLMGIELEGAWQADSDDIPGFRGDGSVNIEVGRAGGFLATIESYRREIRSLNRNISSCQHWRNITFEQAGFAREQVQRLNPTWGLQNNTRVQTTETECTQCQNSRYRINDYTTAIAEQERRLLALGPNVDRTIIRAVGEVASDPLKPHELISWLVGYHPDKQNQSCGTHIHVSLKRYEDYDRLATRKFYTWFTSAVAHWFRQICEIETVPQDVITAFWQRLRGQNRYCCPNYVPCGVHGGYNERNACQHECVDEDYDYEDSPCYITNCEHECDTYENRRDAVSSNRNWRTCLRHTCGHDCVDEDCGETCEHECVDDADCFAGNECVHECESYCYSHDCEHDCREEGCRRGSLDSAGCHTPDIQRQLEDKDSARYAHINYCENFHGTIEFRLFPHFNSARLTGLAIEFLTNCIEEYLDNPANTVDSHETLATIASVQTVVNDTSLVVLPETNPNQGIPVPMPERGVRMMREDFIEIMQDITTDNPAPSPPRRRRRRST